MLDYHNMNTTDKREYSKELINGYEVIEYDTKNIYIIKNFLSKNFCDNMKLLIDKTCDVKLDYKEQNNVRCYHNKLHNMLDGNYDFYYKFSTNPIKYNNLLQNDICCTNDFNGVDKDFVYEMYSFCETYMSKISEIIKKKTKEKVNSNYHSEFEFRKVYGATRPHTDGVSSMHFSNIMSINFDANSALDEFRMIRIATVIFILNDDYIGGEFNFNYQNISFKPNKYDVVIFPPYWTHEHSVSELEKNNFRYTINTWFLEQIK